MAAEASSQGLSAEDKQHILNQAQLGSAWPCWAG